MAQININFLGGMPQDPLALACYVCCMLIELRTITHTVTDYIKGLYAPGP